MFMPGEATDSIALILALIFLLSFSAQKSHVKSQNHLNPSNKRKSTLKFSYPQTAIIKTVEKNKLAPQGYKTPPGLACFNAIFWTQPMSYQYFTDIDCP
jgi:hypothetical protein